MDFKQRVSFREDDHKNLIKFLKDNKIKYKEGDSNIPIAILEILESNQFWPEIKEYISKHNISEYTEGVYTNQEMEKAEWFSLRSKWRWEYPQPVGNFGYQHLITYDDNNYCYECGSGLVQIDSFRVKKSPDWKKRNFFMLNWIEDELFLSDDAKNILLNSGLNGFEFIDVVKPSTETKLEDFNQLKVRNILSPGLVNQNNTIRETTKCKKCGIVKYALTGRGLEYKKSIFRNDVDIVNSFEIFGWGHAAPRGIFVNQKYYQVMISNDLEKHLEFEPIKLI